MFTVALAKGALLKESVSMFLNVGLDFSAVLEDSNRQLMVPSVCGRAKALLVRNSDVPVYVAYGQAQLGIVGFDVLQEQKLQVANLVDLGFGACHMSVAVKSSSGYRNVSDLPPNCRVASKFTNCAKNFFDQIDLPVQLVHLSGSVELGPITGMAEAIVDLVATGRTLRDNGCPTSRALDLKSSSISIRPLSLRVRPVATKSTIASAIPVMGPSSTDPLKCTN